ncbi:RNA polymerase II subunit A C-terminal domain phosphatase [Diorhabda carinulata]|uniref:RNA polymerase II subunit A C-terminal domain phosphatase n=1 Tax=Diorhabda carinulata TaxID=1163345 RepID=UPI0025A10F06|nr:RNA polymerase II subunit A C-terminal domain phosphatase [Diorhabda carinulata]
MAERTISIYQQQTKAIKIIKWKVRKGAIVSIGYPLLTYDFVDATKPEQRKWKSTTAGIVHRILVQEGQVIQPGEVLLELESCSHPTIMNDMCAECGADLRKNDDISTASVPMIHAIPDLKVSEELAQKLGKADNERLLKDRKLALLVDLDQTLIHTTNDNIPPNIKDVHHFQLYGPNSPWYHTRLRPGTKKFLKNIHDFYELHICTFGARNYAHMIATFLDADQNIFSNRILSRDECFDPTSKKANLKALFPCGDNVVCIIDDREDVWSHASNLIHVKPYHFFQHTGDINAPPGLDKHENDKLDTGVDLSKITKNIDVEITKNDQGESGKETSIEKSEQQENNEENAKKENTEIPAEGKVSEKLDITEIPSEKVVETNNEKNSVPIGNETKVKNDNLREENDKKQISVKVQSNQEEFIEIDDPDDYLVYLEEILKHIHDAFYKEYDRLEAGAVPDLKKVIPQVRSQVLKGCRLVFSGLVPTHVKLEQSKAYQVAKGLGAVVTQDIDDETTHLVAVRPGTAKVNSGRRKRKLKIVTPDWLWCCAERWEHVDERIFPLNSKGSKNRHPPPHCSSPEHSTNYPVHGRPDMRKRTPSGKFMDTINPLMSFSSDDIADMDKEVEDILDDESDSSDNESNKKETNQNVTTNIRNSPNESSSSSDDSLTGEYPRGHKRKKIDNVEDPYNSTEDDESPSVKFRRGEDVNDILDFDQDDTQDSIDPIDEVDDGEWNMMGAALEREFLSNN